LDKRIQFLISELTNTLHFKSVEFLATKLNDYEKTNEVITVILSGYISSLILTLKAFIKNSLEPNDVITMDIFCMEILEAFSKIDHVMNVRPLIDNEH
jgi:hypothetical protein